MFAFFPVFRCRVYFPVVFLALCYYYVPYFLFRVSIMFVCVIFSFLFYVLFICSCFSFAFLFMFLSLLPIYKNKTCPTLYIFKIKLPFATPVERFMVQNQHFRRLCIGFWSKMHQRGSKRVPRGSKRVPRWPKRVPKRPQKGPKRVQEGLKGSQEGPRESQEGPKRALKGPQ